MALLLGYNTNGLAHHDLAEAIGLLADIGYQGVAVTLDHAALNPYDDRTDVQLQLVQRLLEKYQLRSVIETGARFLLDPQVKHEPTLVSPDPAARARRVEFLCLAVDIAAQLGADCVSLWSGIVHDGAGDREAMDRLAGGLGAVLDHANRKSVQLAFEPEPEMFVDSLARYGDLVERLERDAVDLSHFRLTIDVGHLQCQGELPIADHIRRWGDRLANIHIEDMKSGVHEHLMIGTGEIDFGPVIATLAEIGYAGLVNVELSRHSHEGPAAARRAYEFLQPLCSASSNQ
jgi:L-ribulose-5-phosphate 3-epimerase